MYVISQRQVSSLQQTLASIERMFDEFPCAFDLDRRLAIGIIGHPFLPKAPMRSMICAWAISYI